MWRTHLQLTQVVTLKTREDNILDLLFTDGPMLVNRKALAVPLSNSADHSIVLFDVDAKPYVPKQKPCTSYQYNKADRGTLKTATTTFAETSSKHHFPMHKPCGTI